MNSQESSCTDEKWRQKHVDDRPNRPAFFSLPTDTGAFNLADHHGKNVIVFFSQRQIPQAAPKKRLRFQY